ncbi:MAG: tetratricopeptide repeat protein, partial [Pseudomonadota bacterium]
MNNIGKIEKLLDNENFDKALAGLKKIKPGKEKGLRLFMKGEALRGLGFFGKAIKEYAAARRVSKGGWELELETLLSDARCNRALGNGKGAVESAKKALALSKKLEIHAAEAELEWALALRLAGRLPEAARLLEKLLKGYKKAGDSTGAAFTLWALGGLYRLQGRYAEGINAFEGSLKYADKGNDRATSGYALFGLGGILRVAGFMGRALDCYARARKLFASTNDAFARAYAECGTANVLRQLGRLEEAYTGYTRAHKLYSGLSDQADLGFVEWGMGEIKK